MAKKKAAAPTNSWKEPQLIPPASGGIAREMHDDFVALLKDCLLTHAQLAWVLDAFYQSLAFRKVMAGEAVKSVPGKKGGNK